MGGNGSEAPESTLNVALEAPASEQEPHLDVARVSYDILRRVFNSFGLEDEGVPYVNETHNAIDFDQIRAR